MTEAPTSLKTLPHLAHSCSSFFETIQLLVAEKNIYYHQYLDTMDEGQCPLPGIMFRKHIRFWQLLCRWGMVRRIMWKITGGHKNSFTWPFKETLRNVTNSFIYLDYCNFCDNRKGPSKTDDTYNQLWELRTVSDKLNDSYVKYYYFSLSGADYSQQLYHSHFMLFKIITATIQTDSCNRPNTRRGKGISTSHHKTIKTSLIHKPAKNKNTYCKTQQTLAYTM